MLIYIPLVKCEECGQEYAQTQVQRVREDDEGGYWDCCQACWAWIEDTADLMEG